ncbi:MAG: hypothetical protein N2Z21_05290 [Candidatus Sumerlaeaceae bacterium]|nr:hypothetical protein [Candidatus Sumerlaeaceae bacterium]
MMSVGGRSQDRNVEGILHYLHDYLSVREQQAIRVNPRIANVMGDVVWAQVENLRQILQGLKSFGPERIRVADILVGDDDLKRKALFSHSDQNSIVHEIINRPDEQRGRVAELAIHDMRTLFRAMDPSLENIVQLIQHWLLWDLPDAADLFHFDLQVARCAYLRSNPLTDELRERYRTALHKRPGEPITDKDIISFELQRLEHILQAFVVRRAEEKAYMMIIRRDEMVGSASSQEILRLAEHLRILEALEKESGPLPSQFKERYAKLLGRTPDEITREQAIDYEKKIIAEGKRRLHGYIEDDRYRGEAYDYKKVQLQQLQERFAAEQKKCEPFLA